jgi:hypothetical protein
MEWFLVIGYTLTIGGITGIIVLLHKRVSFLEDRLLKLAEAGVHLANGLKITADTESAIIDVIRGQITQNESTTT